MKFKLELRGGSLETHFTLSKDRVGKLELNDININFSNFNIYKGTNKFRQLLYNEFITGEYSCYFFIKKDIDNSNIWIKYINCVSIHLNFFKKPFPDFNPYDKIKIIEFNDLN